MLFGRGLAGPVLCPLADDLTAMVAPRPGDLIIDAAADGGVLGASLRRAAGGRARVVLLDADAAAVAESAAAGPDGVLVVRGTVDRPPLWPGGADLVASLLTLAHHPDAGAALRGMASCAHPRTGRVVAAVWAEPAAVPHVAALAGALLQVTGTASPFLTAASGALDAGALEQLAGETGAGTATVRRRRNVVRFNGVDHLLGAHCGEGPLGVEVRSLDTDAMAALRDALRALLDPATARDGTLVLPVEVLVLIASGWS